MPVSLPGAIGLGLGALGVGSSIAGGKKGGGAEKDLGNLADVQAQIAAQLFQQTDPLRDMLFGPFPGSSGLLKDFLSTGELPAALQADVPLTSAREALEAQFGNVERQLRESLPRGGQLGSELAQAGRSRAFGIADLTRQEALREQALRERLFAQTLGVATGTPTQALGGLASAAGGFGQLAQLSQREQLATGQSLGSLAGLATKLALKGGGDGGGTNAALQSGAFELLV